MSDRQLRIAALAFPRPDRAGVLDLARDMVDGGAPAAGEAADMVAAGVRRRLHARFGEAPWRPALEGLSLPLAAVVLALFTVGAVQRVDGPLGGWWALMVLAAGAALLGAALRARPVAAGGWALLLAGSALAALQGEMTRMASRFELYTGSYVIDVQAAILPLLALGLAAALALKPGRRRTLPAVLSAVAAVALAAPESATLELWLVWAVLLAPVALVAYALIRRRAILLLASGLLLAAVSPELIWLAAGGVPYPGPFLALLVLAVAGAAATAGVLRLVRMASRAPR